MKLLTPGTPATADLDHILSNAERRGGPLPVFCAISDNFTQHIITTKQTYLANSLEHMSTLFFNGGDNIV